MIIVTAQVERVRDNIDYLNKPKVAVLPLSFLHALPPAGPACRRRVADRSPDLIHFIILFFLMLLLRCHETSFLQRVALRRLASLASCTHSLFRGSKKVRGGDKAKEDQYGNKY